MKFWKKEEIEYLIEIYPQLETTQEIGEKFKDRTIKSVREKAGKLKLKNTKIKKNVMTLRNKKMGRDLTYESIKELASKYLCKTDFFNNDNSAYITARRNEWLDDVCSHMKFNVISMPQLILRDMLEQLFKQNCKYNTRLIIKPYEIDIYFPELKIGFEYNGFTWHKNDIDSNFKYNLCKEKNILLITICEKLEAKKYYEQIERYLREEIKEKISSINTWLSSRYEASDIDSITINYKKYFMSQEDAKSICDSYSNYTLFKKENESLVAKLSRFSLLETFTSHMKKKNKWNEKNASEMVSKYDRLGDLIKNNFGCYNWIRKNKKSHLLSELIRKKFWNEKEIKEIIDKYDTIKTLKTENKNCYQWIKSHKKYYLLDKFYK